MDGTVASPVTLLERLTTTGLARAAGMLTVSVGEEPPSVTLAGTGDCQGRKCANDQLDGLGHSI